MVDDSNEPAKQLAFERAIRKNTQTMERLLAHQVWSGLGDDKVLSFPYQHMEIKFHLPEGWFDLVQRIILLNRVFYEAPLLENIRTRLEGRPNIIDAGANIGNHSVFFSQLCAAARVHSFEPIPHIQAILRRNAELNASQSIEVHPFALGDTQGDIGIEIFIPANLGSTTLDVDRAGAIPMRTLDSFEFKDINLIKIDVEGMQDPVLRGARDTIADSKPILVIEAFKRDGARMRTTALLETMGYVVDEVVGHNIIAVPK